MTGQASRLLIRRMLLLVLPLLAASAFAGDVDGGDAAAKIVSAAKGDKKKCVIKGKVTMDVGGKSVPVPTRQLDGWTIFDMAPQADGEGDAAYLCLNEGQRIYIQGKPESIAASGGDVKLTLQATGGEQESDLLPSAKLSFDNVKAETVKKGGPPELERFVRVKAVAKTGEKLPYLLVVSLLDEKTAERASNAAGRAMVELAAGSRFASGEELAAVVAHVKKSYSGQDRLELFPFSKEQLDGLSSQPGYVSNFKNIVVLKGAGSPDNLIYCGVSKSLETLRGQHCKGEKPHLSGKYCE